MATFAHPPRPTSSAAPTHQTVTAQQLPTGPCHFRDLNGGRDAFECGCRQFWLNEADPAASVPNDGSPTPTSIWCFCGHHGCYHELRRSSQAPVEARQLETEHNVSEWPVEILSRGDMTRGHGNLRGGSHTPQALFQPMNQHVAARSSNAKGLGLFETAAGPATQGSPRLGQLNPQNFFADYLPSTQASDGQRSRATSIVRAASISSPTNLFRSQFDSHRPSRPQLDARNLPRPTAQDEQAHSATEIATPSNAGTPVLRDTDEAFRNLRATLEAFNRRDASDNLSARDALADRAPGVLQPVAKTHYRVSDMIEPVRGDNQSASQLSRQIASLRMLLLSTPNISTSIASLNNRLEALETVSFSHIPIEEIYDKFENFDGRILDTEARLDELERSRALRRHRRGENNGSSANASFDSTMSDDSGPAQMDPELVDRIMAQTLIYEQRLRSLEAHALPSVAKPWEVEVVLLPFGQSLKGLWGLVSDDSQSRRQGSESATPAQGTQSGAIGGQASPIEWKKPGSDPLVARACGPSRGLAGLVYERLRSRGFVKNITVHGNTAKHIASVILSLFKDQLTLFKTNIKDQSVGYSDLLGLQLPFVPLRKVHRSSTLRHLSAAELVTPTLWTAEFLDSSIFMRAPSTGLRRLFITSPQAYLPVEADKQNWTWSAIRELPRFKEDASPVVEEADAAEPCWTWDARLDAPASVHTSMSSSLSYHSSFDSHMLSPQQTSVHNSSSGLSESSGLADSDYDVDARGDLIPMSAPQSPITPVSSLFASSTARHRRPASEPNTQPPVPASLRTSIQKRQISSFDHVSTSLKLSRASKRRRTSRSPEDLEPMEMWNLTPRRSREPPSPYPHGESSMMASRRASMTGRRKAPPMVGAYATPYSADVMSRLDTDGEGTDLYDDDDNDDDDDDEGYEEDSASDDVDYEDRSSRADDEDHAMSEDVQFAQGIDTSPNGGVDVDADADEDDIWEGVDEEEEDITVSYLRGRSESDHERDGSRGSEEKPAA